MKSGMSLTQIFSQYVTVSEQLHLVEEENKRLNNYIDQIVQVSFGFFFRHFRLFSFAFPPRLTSELLIVYRYFQEIENRAPAIARQREDYEKSMELAANLSRQLELAAEEAKTERKNAEEARRLSSQMERSSLQYQKQVSVVQ